MNIQQTKIKIDKKLNNMKKTNKYRICPKCKSKNVSPDFSIKTFGEKSEFNKFKCNNCGYSSIFFPEIGKTIINKKSK